MAALSFVIVEPGNRASAASKHEQRVGIHSHAQRVTQQRKRDRRIQEAEKITQSRLSVTKIKPDTKQIVKRINQQHDLQTLIGTVQHKRFMGGLPTPSPEPDFDRPFTSHSLWIDDHKFGVSMFLHLTILDINEVATNMNFWNYVVPSYAEVWTCVRDIVSAIACANQAIQTRDNDLILVALRLHLHAISTLRRDLMSLPLSAQVACCLLFDAFNVLRCDFVQAGTQIATARQLTKGVQLDAYLEDENLATVFDALNQMSQSSAWSLWNPSYFLRYEGLRHAEPNLFIELQPIDEKDGTLKGLVQSMERLSRQFSGRIRRNLAENACVEPDSILARDVLTEFRIWRKKFENYKLNLSQPTERATIQQAELAWNFTYITFTGGVLNSNSSAYDDPLYLTYYNRINNTAQQRFVEAATHNSNANIKAFLQIIIPSLWLMILMCRIPEVRARAIGILKSHDYQEGEFNSLVASRMAEIVVDLETRNRDVQAACEIPLHDRVRVQGIKYVSATQEVVLSYSSEIAKKGPPPSSMLEKRIFWKPKGDTIKFSNAILALSQSCTLYRKVRASAAPNGCIKPMYYQGSLVSVITR